MKKNAQKRKKDNEESGNMERIVTSVESDLFLVQ